MDLVVLIKDDYCDGLGDCLPACPMNAIQIIEREAREYDEEGTLTSETENIEPLPVEKIAKCRRYEAAPGWYGLMSADGKVITPPSYCSIKAIGYDMYLCKDNSEDGVILNGKGQPTNK